MHKEPKTADEAAWAYWFDAGLGAIGELTALMVRRKAIIEDAFMAGVRWQQLQEKRKAAVE